jgi:adenylate cyclase
MTEQDDKRLQELEAELKRKTDEIGILTRVAVELSGTLDLGPLLTTILASMDDVFGFEHSMVLLLDSSRDVLVVAASRGYDQAGIGAEVPVGKGVIGVVGKRKKLMRMGGVKAQRGYMKAASGKGGDSEEVALPGLPDVDSIVAIPLLKGAELIGVFYVESERAAVFDDSDLALIEAIASQAAIAIQNARYHQAEKERLEELQRANESLTEWNESSSRFIPYEFLSILGRDRLPEVKRGDHAELDMSTFFSDVRDYTTLVEGQGPEQNFAFINEYLTYMEAPIREHEGFIDSYRGDGIMALFAGCADDAVTAAVESMNALARLNEVRTGRGEAPVRIGIGIDTGHLMLGTIGGQMRLSAGVIGDSANTASRIESLTKRYGVSVLISENTRDACKNSEKYRMRPIDRVRPRGKANPITLYEVLEGLPDEELQGKLAGLAEFEEGWRLYQGGDPGEGLVHFAAALKAAPGDRAAQLYIGRCWNFIENGVPDDWDGVITMTTK